MANIGTIEVAITHRVRERETIIAALQSIRDRLDSDDALVSMDMLPTEHEVEQKDGVRHYEPAATIVRFIVTPRKPGA